MQPLPVTSREKCRVNAISHNNHRGRGFTMINNIFPNLAAAVNKYYDDNASKFAADVATVTTRAALDMWYYRDRMTPAAFRDAQAADPVATLPESVRAKMIKRYNAENEKNRAARLRKLETAAEAKPLTTADVVVTRCKSRTWGHNPDAEVMTETCRTTGHASGCGYDKESAAIAQAFNAHPSIMRALYEHAENGGAFPYSVYTTAGVPWFDGGCGVSCFRNVFEALGYTWRDVSHGKTFDVYAITK